MYNKLACQSAIISLKENGYCQDFILFGEYLLWVQEKVFIPETDFSILECHQFGHPGDNDEDFVVFGIVALNESIKGILLNHYSYTTRSPFIIVKKLRELEFY